MREIKFRAWNKIKMLLLNTIDFRYWFCDCEYFSPYGIVVNSACAKHDIDNEIIKTRCENCGGFISDDGFTIDKDKSCFYCELG